MTDTPFAVNIWGSHPAEANDDCWSGDDFATIGEARAAFAAECKAAMVGCVEIVGPGVEEIFDTGRRENPPEDSGSWLRERAMEAGMLHGVHAYNEVMGCDVEDDYYR